MAAVRVKTFKDIYEAVMRRMKLPLNDTDALNACKEAINTRYDSIAFRRKWRWRKKRWDMRIPTKKTAGTFSVTNDSRTIVGTGTGLTSTHVGWFIELGPREEVYEIIALNVGTQTAELSAAYVDPTDATASYTAYKSEHGLPPDCEELEVVWHDHRRYPVDLISPRQMIEAMSKNPGAEGWATGVTVWGTTKYDGPTLGEMILGHDFLGSDNKTSLRMSTYPHIPDEDYTMHILYTQKIDPLDADTDEPLIPLEKRHVLVYGAYADLLYRERIDETGAYWDAKFESVVREIEQDAEFTDERPNLMVAGKWWRKNRRNSLNPESADLGGWFDRHYTPYDNN
jgi:hypothetical protein